MSAIWLKKYRRKPQAPVPAKALSKVLTKPLSKALSKIRLFLARNLSRLTAMLSPRVDITQRSSIEPALNLAKLGMSGQVSAADAVAIAGKTLADGGANPKIKAEFDILAEDLAAKQSLRCQKQWRAARCPVD